MTYDCTSDSSLCSHFGVCGGCARQDVPYAEQLAAKARALEELLSVYWQDPVEIIPSPAVWHYRNKVDFTFGRKFYETPPPKGVERETVLGFKQRGRWFRAMDIHECRIANPEVGALLEAVRRWAKEQGLQGLDTRTKKGALKVLLAREGKRTGERLVALYTMESAIDTASFVEAVRGAYPGASVQWGVSNRTAHVVHAERMAVLDGPPHIYEEMRIGEGATAQTLRFRISPESFFQTNTLAAERLYTLLRAWVAETAGAPVYDFYGGAGGIALACAGLAPEIVSVENVEPASEDGRHNAALNGIDTVSFVTQPVEEYLKTCADSAHPIREATVIVDPPRAGLRPKALARLIELRPPRLIYVSCKPSVFIGEMAALDAAYVIEDARAVDLFPHTPHVELAVRLRRR